MTPTIRHEKLTEKPSVQSGSNPFPKPAKHSQTPISSITKSERAPLTTLRATSMFQKYSRRKGRPSLITQAFEDGEPNASPCSESLNFWDLCGNRRTVRDYSYFCSAGNRR